MDERGYVVAGERPSAEGLRTLTASVSPDASYLSPALGIVPHEMAEATVRFEGRRYFVEFLARPGTNPGRVQGELQVATTLGPTRP